MNRINEVIKEKISKEYDIMMRKKKRLPGMMDDGSYKYSLLFHHLILFFSSNSLSYIHQQTTTTLTKAKKYLSSFQYTNNFPNFPTITMSGCKLLIFS